MEILQELQFDQQKFGIVKVILYENGSVLIGQDNDIVQIFPENIKKLISLLHEAEQTFQPLKKPPPPLKLKDNE